MASKRPALLSWLVSSGQATNGAEAWQAGEPFEPTW